MRITTRDHGSVRVSVGSFGANKRGAFELVDPDDEVIVSMDWLTAAELLEELTNAIAVKMSAGDFEPGLPDHIRASVDASLEGIPD